MTKRTSGLVGAHAVHVERRARLLEGAPLPKDPDSADPPTAEVDEELRARLRELGYVD